MDPAYIVFNLVMVGGWLAFLLIFNHLDKHAAKTRRALAEESLRAIELIGEIRAEAADLRWLRAPLTDEEREKCEGVRDEEGEEW